MPEVLVLGVDPVTVPGIDADAVQRALDHEQTRFAELGIPASITLVVPDENVDGRILTALTSRPWDVVVVGGGIRKPASLVEFFEHVVNLVHRHAPRAAIAFNTTVSDTVEAARRHLPT